MIGFGRIQRSDKSMERNLSNFKQNIVFTLSDRKERIDRLLLVLFFIFIKIHIAGERLSYKGQCAFENLILIANTSSCEPISISFFIDSYETFRRNESAQVDNPSSKLSVSFLPRRNGASGGCEERRRPSRIPVTGSKRKTRLANRSRALSNERNEPVITRWTCNTSGNLSFLPRT